MQNEILTLNEGLDQAFNNSMLAVERGNFKKAIELLEYVERYKADYDEVMLNYVLLISYYNSGQMDKTAMQLQKLNQLYIADGPIKEVIDSIRDEMSKKKTMQQERVEKFILHLFTSNENIDKLIEEYPEDDFLKLIKSPRTIGQFDQIAEMIKIANEQKIIFIAGIENFKQFDDKFTPLGIWTYFKTVEDNPFFWMLLTRDDINMFYKNEALPDYFKNFVTISLMQLVDYKIYKNTELSKFSGIKKELLKIDNRRIGYLIEEVVELYNEEIEYELVKAVVDLVIINNFPQDIFTIDYPTLVATICYIINDVIIGREYDEIISKQLGVRFVDVKQEIKKYKQLITFLIS